MKCGYLAGKPGVLQGTLTMVSFNQEGRIFPVAVPSLAWSDTINGYWTHTDSFDSAIVRIRQAPSYPWYMFFFYPHRLTLKHRETHGCVVSTMATDALVLKHQAISILSTD